MTTQETKEQKAQEKIDAKNARRRELAAIKKNKAVNESFDRIESQLKAYDPLDQPYEESQVRETIESNVNKVLMFPAKEVDNKYINKVLPITPEEPTHMWPRRVIIKEKRIINGETEFSVQMWTNSGLRQAISCEIEEYADAAIEGMQNLAMKLYKQAFPVETRTKEEN